MKTKMLDYYLHDEPDAFRLELSGNLSGDGAQSVFQAWRTALSVIGERPVIVDISYVNSVDETGGALLRLWHNHGARIIASTVESSAIAESTLGEPVSPMPQRARFFDRVREAVFGRTGTARMSTHAEWRGSLSTDAPQGIVAITGFPDAQQLEWRVP